LDVWEYILYATSCSYAGFLIGKILWNCKPIIKLYSSCTKNETGIYVSLENLQDNNTNPFISKNCRDYPYILDTNEELINDITGFMSDAEILKYYAAIVSPDAGNKTRKEQLDEIRATIDSENIYIKKYVYIIDNQWCCWNCWREKPEPYASNADFIAYNHNCCSRLNDGASNTALIIRAIIGVVTCVLCPVFGKHCECGLYCGLLAVAIMLIPPHASKIQIGERHDSKNN
jgi:hypothetical protein